MGLNNYSRAEPLPLSDVIIQVALSACISNLIPPPSPRIYIPQYRSHLMRSFTKAPTLNEPGLAIGPVLITLLQIVNSRPQTSAWHIEIFSLDIKSLGEIGIRRRISALSG